MDELVTYKILKKDTETGEEYSGIDEVAFTSDPAVITKGLAFKSSHRFHFSDKPKMRIVAPAMIPMEIYRNQDGEEFNVAFTAEQIEELHKDLMLKMRETNLFNFEHDKGDKVPAYILEAWIVDNPKEDKAWSTYGIDVPKGTLMLTTQITDEAFYNKIVENDQIGYSIGGAFGLKLSKQVKQSYMMQVPDGEHLINGQIFVFSNGVVTEVKSAPITLASDEETKPEETETPVEEVKEEMAEETKPEEVQEEMAEEVATEEAPAAEAVTAEQVSAMIDEKMSEVVGMLAELKAKLLETESVEEEKEEEAAPVMLSAHERLAQFSKSFNKK